MSNVKGYKVFNPDWTCRGFQYEVGKTFEHDGNIELCGSGFHFCQKASDCFNYYVFNSNNKVAEVEALDLVETKGNKSVTNKIHIIREIPWQELLAIVNTGKDCTGLENTGDWNTGDCNTVDFSNGVFCTKEDTIKIFDKESNMTLREWRESRARKIIAWNMETTVWIYESSMTEQEKAQYQSYKTTGGYLKVFTYSEAWNNLWNSITDKEKQEIMNIPNFDKNKFKEITGIEI